MNSRTCLVEQRALEGKDDFESPAQCPVTSVLKRLNDELTQRAAGLSAEFDSVEKRLTRLERLEPEFELLKERLTRLESSKSEVTRLIRIKDVDFKTIKDEINRIIHEHVDGIDTLTLAEQLEIDPLLVLKAVDELKGEGKIDKAD